MKNVFYFIFKALFILKIFQFLSRRFGHVGELLDQKDQVNFKLYDITTSGTNNCNAYIPQYLKKYKLQGSYSLESQGRK